MSSPRQIGITGGIGSGKSLISRIFSCLLVPVYDADSRAKYLMTTDGILISSIKKEFGDLSYNNNGELNRQYLAEFVFSNEERLQVLNSLVHPRVSADYERWVSDWSGKAPYVLKEAALLFESGSYKLLDEVILVTAPESLRMERVLRRDPHRSQEQVLNIMRNQLQEEKAEALAHHVIRNDESVLVIPQVLTLHRRFSK